MVIWAKIDVFLREAYRLIDINFAFCHHIGIGESKLCLEAHLEPASISSLFTFRVYFLKMDPGWSISKASKRLESQAPGGPGINVSAVF
jgi:hypothetical protein